MSSQSSQSSRPSSVQAHKPVMMCFENDGGRGTTCVNLSHVKSIHRKKSDNGSSEYYMYTTANSRLGGWVLTEHEARTVFEQFDIVNVSLNK